MPKKSKEINPFDGGWNNFSSARDVEENELALAVNVDCNVKGQVSARPQINDTALTYTIHKGSHEPYHNHEGLYVYNRDFNLAFGGRADTEIYLFGIYDETDNSDTTMTTRLLVADSLAGLNLDSATEIMDYQEGGGRVKLNIFNSDGNLRISQGQLNNATNKYTLFYGATEKLKQADNVVTIYSGIEQNIIGPPTNGVFYAGEMNESTNTTDASLHLNINSVKSFTSDWFRWDVGQVGYPHTVNEDNLETTRDTLAELETGENNSGGSSDINAGFIPTANAETGGQTLQHPTHPGTRDIYALTLDSSEGQEEVAFINGNPVDFKDKSVFVDIWIPTTCYNVMNTTGGLTICVGSNVHVNEVSSTGMWKFLIPSSELKEEEWFTFECVYGSHDEIVGNPNSSAVDGILFDLDMPGATYWDTDWYMSLAIGNVKVGESSQGTWLGKYKFYYNWIYDETQYGPTKEFTGQPSGGTEYLGDILELKTYLEPSATDGCWDRVAYGSDTFSKRITGANVFFAELDNLGEIVDNDKKFLANMDFNKGIRKDLYDNFTAFSSTGALAPVAGRTHAKILYKSPATIDTFATICGYSEGDKIKHMRFGASEVLNNRSYVGNVGMIEDDLDKEMYYPDRVYKSVQNQPDVYTKYDYLEVSPNDGESVTALSSYGDYLLEFKENTMYLVNVTQDVEYLEETYKFRGVWHENAICKTGKGICWANKYGLFLFDGKEVIDLGKEKMDNVYWNTNIADPSIAFDPIRNEVFVQMNKSGGVGVRYNFDREHFVKINHADANLFNSMNLVTNKNGDIITFGNTVYSESEALHTVNFRGDGTSYINIETKDHSFDDGSRRKDLKTVYINYSVTGSSLPTVKYRKDMGTWRSFDVGFANTTGSMVTAILKPATPSEAKNGRSFQIQIKGNSIATEGNQFTINDINLVYREKSIK